MSRVTCPGTGGTCGSGEGGCVLATIVPVECEFTPSAQGRESQVLAGVAPGYTTPGQDLGNRAGPPKSSAERASCFRYALSRKQHNFLESRHELPQVTQERARQELPRLGGGIPLSFSQDPAGCPGQPRSVEEETAHRHKH